MQVTGALAYLDDLLERDIKALVFAHHLEILDAVSAHLSRKAVRHIRIDGNTPQHLRQEMCTRFQEDTVTKAGVLSITAAGVGLTLHAASTVVFIELYWNPGNLLQAEDRAHRLGQKKVQFAVFYLLTSLCTWYQCCFCFMYFPNFWSDSDCCVRPKTREPQNTCT